MNAPGTWNFDLSLHREFRLTERYTLQFRWESFTFTNSVVPNQPVSVLGHPGFVSILTVTGIANSRLRSNCCSDREPRCVLL